MTWLTQPSRQTRRHGTHKSNSSVPPDRDHLRAGLGTARRAGVGVLGFTSGLCAGGAACGLEALVLTIRLLIVEVVGRCQSVQRGGRGSSTLSNTFEPILKAGNGTPCFVHQQKLRTTYF